MSFRNAHMKHLKIDQKGSFQKGFTMIRGQNTGRIQADYRQTTGYRTTGRLQKSRMRVGEKKEETYAS